MYTFHLPNHIPHIASQLQSTIKPIPTRYTTHIKPPPLTTTLIHENSNLANTSSLLYHALHSLPSPSNATNWAGFYVLDRSASSTSRKQQQLILGPFHGHVACQTIAVGRGVCGAAAASKVTQLVADVEQFPGHIACDSRSKSEIVVPVLQGGEVCFFPSLTHILFDLLSLPLVWEFSSTSQVLFILA